MSIEVRPVGVTCNLQCTYCYEESMREVQRSHRYNREAVLAAIDKLAPNEYFSLFGGEALILPLKDLDELLQIAHTRFGHSGVQTNASLITEKHIELFIKYNTHVGISMDGPDELNDSRWAGTLEATRKQTQRTMWALKELCARAVTTPHLLPSLIVTLHAGNCRADRFPRFLEWLHELDTMGVRHVNMHLMEMDHKAHELYLPSEEIADRLIEIWNILPSFKQLHISKFDEILKLQRGNGDSVVCHWKPCDPWNTSAVNGIENDGSPSHCSRTNKDGQNWLPAEGCGTKNGASTFIGHPGARHFERQLALYVTPQEYGGCQGCEYWLMCYGQCPGEGANHDWRMRSTYCGTFKRLFAEGARRLRAAGEVPFSEHPKRTEIEAQMYAAWSQEETPYLSKYTQPSSSATPATKHGDQHGDHTDTQPHTHGDVPHGDYSDHGDHTDVNKR